MKRIWAMLLLAAMVLPLFCGCDGNKPNHNDTEAIVLNLDTPTAMISFGDSGVAGVTAAEPADISFLGTSEVNSVSVLVGDNDSTYAVRTLQGYGSEMTFTLTGVTPNAPAMIDIEEIHLREDVSLSYSVYVNGTEVFGRTYAPIADGPNHAFFDISADVVGSSGSLTVRLVNQTDGEVRFRRAWAISEPETLAASQGIDKKMDVVLMLNYVPENLNYGYLQSLVNSYRCKGMYNIGLCWEIQYLQWGKEKTEKCLNEVITASIQTGAVLYLGINSWWGGTPSGPDGQGGMWQDVPYQQITWDPNNSDGRGNWQLSSPNEWSNTPWLSMNNDYYNQVRIQRIKETVEFIQLRTAELALAGRNLPPIHLYTENEPYYWPINWAQYDFDKNPNGVGDFSPWVIADAAADGITLDPTDGLSKEEALWLYRNLNTYISEVGNAMAEGLGYNYITIKDGQITYPTEQIVADSYSHTPIHPIYPNWNENQRAWENHVLDSIHFGGEWSIFQDKDDVRALDYLIAYGSFSNINAERAGFPGGFSSKDFRVLSQCYAYGLEGVIIYNVLADSDQQNVINESSVQDTPMEIRQYQTAPIFQSDFTKRTAFSVGKNLTEISGLRWDDTAVVPNGANGGSLTYRVSDAANYSTGVEVVTAGTFAAAGGRLEVLAGKSPDSLQSVGVYDSANQSVFVDPSFYAGGEDIYIRVRVYGDGLTSGQLSTLSLSRVGIYRPIIEIGCTDGSVYSYAENRIRSQIIAVRADAERLLNAYMERIGGKVTTQSQKEQFEKAYNLYAKGCYGEAFAAISQAISQILPATFTVSGYGQLGEYPVEIQVKDDPKVTVGLKEVSDKGIRFTLSASDNTTVTISLLTKTGTWSLTQENGEYVISDGGETAPTDGKVSFQIDLQQRVAKECPDEFEARLIYSGPNHILIQSQDPRVTDYCFGKEFSLAQDAVVFRGADGTTKEDMKACDVTELRAGDYVQVKLNEKGWVTEVYAWYGQITGKVIKVEEMSILGTMSNAFVTVQSEDGTTLRLEIGYDSEMQFTGATGELGKLCLVESIGLEEGQQITVYYCPYEVNGRIRVIRITD